MLVIDGTTARHLLPMDRCIDLMDEALIVLARGNAANPLRTMLLMPFPTPVPSVLASMPAALGDPPSLGIKIISVFPSNHGTEVRIAPGLRPAVRGGARQPGGAD